MSTGRLEASRRAAGASLTRIGAVLAIAASATIACVTGASGAATPAPAPSSRPASGSGNSTPAATFTLGFVYAGGSYTALVYGSSSDYATVVSTDSSLGAVAPQALYLAGAAQGTYPVSAISVYPGVAGQLLAPEVTGALRAAMLQQVFTWAWVYSDIYVLDEQSGGGSTAAESFVETTLPAALGDEWQQELGITAGSLDVQTVDAELAGGFAGTLGAAGAAQIGNFAGLLVSVLDDDAGGSFSGEWSSIASSLQGDGIVAGASYTAPQVLGGLQRYPAASVPALLSHLYQLAYPSEPGLTPAATTTAAGVVTDLLTGSAATSAEITFSDTAGSALGTGAAAAASDLVAEGVPWALAAQSHGQPVQSEAYALQEEVDLQDAESGMLTQFEDQWQVLGEDTPASVSLGVAGDLFDLDGLMLAAGKRWTDVDGELVQSEALRCATDASGCQAQEQSDSSTGGSLQQDASGMVAYGQEAATFVAATPPNPASQRAGLPAAPPRAGAAALTLAPGILTTTAVGEPYAVALPAAGGTAPLTFAVTSGTLPQGLQLSGATGQLAGQAASAGSFSFTVSVGDSGAPRQNASAHYTVVVLPQPLAITTASLPAGATGEPYAAGLSAGWGTGPYTWSIAAGALPAGLALSPTTGVVSGAPASAGEASLTVAVTDSESPPVTATATFTLDVLPSSDQLTSVGIPNDGQTDELGSVSCVAAGDCFAVGSATATRIPLVEHESDGIWSIVPLPGALTAAGASLSGVSCTSDSFCMAVGTSDASGGAQALALEWDGTSWSALPSPDSADASHLTGVSCTSPASCLAVGYSVAPATLEDVPLAVAWQGDAWALDSPTSPSTGELTSISCSPDGALCAAGGYLVAGTQAAFVETWDGSWTADTSLPPSIDSLDAVSCPTSSSCTAVGSAVGAGGGTPYPAGVTFDGTSWSQVMTSFGPDTFGTLLGVSCASAAWCVAVGSDGGGPDQAVCDATGQCGDTLVVAGAAGGWSAVGSPWPVPGPDTLDAVTCDPDCTAVGDAGGEPLAATSLPPPVASPPAASISSFSASPASLPPGGGTVTLGWTAAEATACLVTSAPALPGLPEDVPCSPGAATVAVPGNTTVDAQRYTFWLEAIGSGGTPAATSAEVVAVPAPPAIDFSWNEVPLPGFLEHAEIGELQCVSSNTCWALGTDEGTGSFAVWRTTDGGLVWTESLLPGSGTESGNCDAIAGSCLAAGDAEHVYVVASNGTDNGSESLWASTDGGASWTEEALPTGGYAHGALACPGPETCLLASASDLWETTDGGTGWAAVGGNYATATGGDGVDALACASTTDCLAAGHGSLYATSDGGGSWSTAGVAGSAPTLGCDAAGDCWIGDGSTLHVSTDGGVDWTAEMTVPAGPISHASCATATTCLVESSGGVFSTLDGGAGWLAVTPAQSYQCGSTCGGIPDVEAIALASATGPAQVLGLDTRSAYGSTVDWSGTGSPRTAPTTAPTSVKATAGNRVATISFTPPSGNGGSPITSYTVVATDETTPANGGQTVSGPSSPITVSGLTDGDRYTFTVSSANAVGVGPSSTPSTPVSPALTPTSTTLVVGEPTVVYGKEQVQLFKVTVGPPAPGLPTGSVAIVEGTTVLCRITLSSGTGTCAPSAGALASGTFTVAAHYSGDTNFAASVSKGALLKVSKATSSSALTLSLATVTYGHEQLEHFSVQVKPQFTGTPGGAVTVRSGTHVLCTAYLSAGRAACSPSAGALAAGTYTITASYTGSVDFVGSTSAGHALVVAR